MLTLDYFYQKTPQINMSFSSSVLQSFLPSNNRRGVCPSHFHAGNSDSRVLVTHKTTKPKHFFSSKDIIVRYSLFIVTPILTMVCYSKLALGLAFVAALSIPASPVGNVGKLIWFL